MTDQALGRLGRFEIAEELGRGAMGVVYRGMHPGLGVPVAIKVLAETYSRDESFRARFQREAATVASLNHPGIVRIYDFDAHQGALFIVMEFVEGRTLRGWLNESGRFTLAVSQDLIQQLLSAVGAAHVRGIVHRDLKPDNVIISTQGKTKITDFGISKVLDDSASLTATGSMVGTPAYMSPEQVRGEAVDGRADIYALGIILYELLHGRPPFAGSMPAVLHSQVFDQPRPSTAIPRPVFDVIVKAMAKDPADRFQSCEEFSGALLGSGTRPEIPPPPQAAPPSRSRRRSLTTCTRAPAAITTATARRAGSARIRTPPGCAAPAGGASTTWRSWTGLPSAPGMLQCSRLWLRPRARSARSRRGRRSATAR